MKVFKLLPEKGKITRETLSHLGNWIYQSDEVREVVVKVKFKDGVEMGFKKNEAEDELLEFLREDDKE
ncbi:hypothetical protein J4205_01480 [Candidatus Pacearchaeota archaeon]|nr:hypothetical protein [Candidatus Pacearchaeota archaeon]